MRRLCLTALVPLALLGACSKGGQGGVADAGPGAEPISCALGGAADFKPDCTLEIQSAGKEVWVVRHPDGGFRRFEIIENGTLIATADGADEVVARRVGAELEVKVGEDRYRFPAAPEASASVAVPEPGASGI